MSTYIPSWIGIPKCSQVHLLAFHSSLRTVDLEDVLLSCKARRRNWMNLDIMPQSLESSVKWCVLRMLGAPAFNPVKCIRHILAVAPRTHDPMTLRFLKYRISLLLSQWRVWLSKPSKPGCFRIAATWQPIDYHKLARRETHLRTSLVMNSALNSSNSHLSGYQYLNRWVLVRRQFSAYHKFGPRLVRKWQR